MASQFVETSASFQLDSSLRDHHVYFRSWALIVGELLPVKRKILNEYDPLL